MKEGKEASWRRSEVAGRGCLWRGLSVRSRCVAVRRLIDRLPPRFRRAEASLLGQRFKASARTNSVTLPWNSYGPARTPNGISRLWNGIGRPRLKLPGRDFYDSSKHRSAPRRGDLKLFKLLPFPSSSAKLADDLLWKTRRVERNYTYGFASVFSI